MSAEGAHIDPGLGDAVNAVLAMQGVYDNRYSLPIGDGSVPLNDGGVGGGAGSAFSLSGLDDNEGLSALVNAAEVTADLQMQYHHDGGLGSSTDADVHAQAQAQAEAEAARRREVDDFGLDPMDHGGHDVGGDGGADDLMPFYADQLSLPRAQPEHEVRGRHLHHPDAEVGVGLGAGEGGMIVGGGQVMYDGVDQGQGQLQQPLQQQHHIQHPHQHQQLQLQHQQHQQQHQQQQQTLDGSHHAGQAQTLSTPSEPPAKRARRTKAGTPSPLSLQEDDVNDDGENAPFSPNAGTTSGRRGGKASTAAGKSPHGSRPTLERKIAHKVAEQQRRAMIRTGYEALYAVIPALAEAELQEGKVRGGSGPGGGGAVGGKRRDRIRMQTKPDDEEAAARAAQATLDSALRKRGPKKGSKRPKKLSPEEEEEMEREREREQERAHQSRQQQDQERQHQQQDYSNVDIINGGGQGGSGNGMSDFVNDVTLAADGSVQTHSHSHGHGHGHPDLADEHAVNDHLSSADPDAFLGHENNNNNDDDDNHHHHHPRSRSQSQGKSTSYPPKPTKEIANVRNTAHEIVDGRQGPRSETVVLQTTIDYLREQQHIRISHLSRLQTLRALAYVKFPPNQHEELGLGPRWVEADEDVIQPVGGMTARGGRPMAGKKDGDEEGGTPSTRASAAKGKGKGKGKKKAEAEEAEAHQRQQSEAEIELGGGQVLMGEQQQQSEIDSSFNIATGSSGVVQASSTPFTAANGEQDAASTLAGFVPPSSTGDDATSLFVPAVGGQAGENNDIDMDGGQQQASGTNAGPDAFEPIRKVWVNWEDDWQGAKAVETAMGGA